MLAISDLDRDLRHLFHRPIRASSLSREAAPHVVKLEEQAVAMVVKAYARSIKCSAHPPTAVKGGDRLPDETSTQSLQGFFDPAELDWLAKAARLPGRSLHLAVVLVFVANAANAHQVALSNLASQQFGLTRN